MLTLSAFLTGKADRVVYWGTGGERIAEHYAFDSFCKKELIQNGIRLYGKDIRDQLPAPSAGDLPADIARCCDTFKKHARDTGRSLYTFGRMPDISRCLYTLAPVISHPKHLLPNGHWKTAFVRILMILRIPLCYAENLRDAKPILPCLTAPKRFTAPSSAMPMCRKENLGSTHPDRNELSPFFRSAPGRVKSRIRRVFTGVWCSDIFLP